MGGGVLGVRYCYLEAGDVMGELFFSLFWGVGFRIRTLVQLLYAVC